MYKFKKSMIMSALSIALAMFGMSSFASEDSGKSGFSVGAHAGTAGIGGQVSYGFNDKFSVSVGAQQFKYSFDEEYEAIDYSGDLNLESYMLLGHLHPFDGGFRLTAGVVSNSNSISAIGKSSGGGVFEIDGTDYTAADVGSVGLDVDFDEYAGYVGVGFGAPVNSDNTLTLTFDAGAILQGEGNVSLTSEGGLLSGDALFNEKLKAEQAAVQEDISDYTWHPVLQIGLHYQF